MGILDRSAFILKRFKFNSKKAEECSGLHDPIDYGECKKAANELGKTFRGTERDKNYPKDCYIDENKDVYWNFHKAGKADYFAKPICKLGR